MGKSFFERLARGLGKTTGKLVEKAREQGFDRKLKDLVEKYEEGQSEAREEAEAGSPDGEEPSPEEQKTPGRNRDERKPEDRACGGLEGAAEERRADEPSPSSEGDEGGDRTR